MSYGLLTKDYADRDAVVYEVADESRIDWEQLEAEKREEHFEAVWERYRELVKERMEKRDYDPDLYRHFVQLVQELKCGLIKEIVFDTEDGVWGTNADIIITWGVTVYIRRHDYKPGLFWVEPKWGGWKEHEAFREKYGSVDVKDYYGDRPHRYCTFQDVYNMMNELNCEWQDSEEEREEEANREYRQWRKLMDSKEE